MIRLVQAVLVVIDISGYTRFIKLNTLSLIHAEQIITDLLDAVIEEATYPLSLNKLEGDAAFLFATVPEGIDPAEVAADTLQQVTTFFDIFNEMAKTMAAADACQCEACRHVGDLRLKAIMHLGEVAIKKLRGFEELAGEPVILVHRLLKNAIPQREYLLFSDAVGAVLPDARRPAGSVRQEIEVADLGRSIAWLWLPSPDSTPVEPPSAAMIRIMRLRWFRRYIFRLFGLAGRPFAHLPKGGVRLGGFLRDVFSLHGNR